jgi:DNA-binding beta-propeller fold protein YncE
VADPRSIVFDTNGTDMWVASTSSSTVIEMSSTGTLKHTFGTGLLQNPYGLDNDSSGVYVADTYNKRVVKLDIYVADTDNNRIVVLSPSGTCVAAFGSTGTGQGQFNSPWTLLSDGAGGLWVADAMNYRVEHVSNTGTYISASGSFGTGIGQFRAPHGLFMDGGLLDIADPYVYSIQRFTISAGVLTYSSTLGGVPPAAGGFNGTFAAAYGPRGELYVVDWFNDRIQKFNPDGSFAMQWGGYGSPTGSFIFPRGIAVTPDGNTVVVTNSEDNRIDLFGSTGTYVGTVKPSGTTFSRPQQTALAPDGSYWVADTLDNRVVHLNSAGTVLGNFTNGGAMKTPQGIAMDAEGNLYVSDSGNNAVEKYDQSGTLIATLATPGSGPTNVSQPFAITVIGLPGHETLLIGDAGNNRILELGTNGAALLSFGAAGSGDGQLSSPRGAVLNPVTGELAVSDFANNRVSVWGTAAVTASRTPVPPAPAGTSSGRSPVTQSAAGKPGPRLSSGPTRVVTSQTRDESSAQRNGLVSTKDITTRSTARRSFGRFDADKSTTHWSNVPFYPSGMLQSTSSTWVLAEYFTVATILVWAAKFLTH